MRPGRPSLSVRLGLCGLAALAILLLAYVPIWIKGIDTIRVTRDPAALAELPVYTGALSIAGVMAWTVRAGACLLAALILHVVAEDSIWLEDYFKFCGLAIGVGFWLLEARDAVLVTRLAPD